MDTSAAMERHAPATLKVVTDLIRSGAGGQLHPGDTLGFWTFNSEVYAGNFPLQIWAPENREEIALGVSEFLRQQRYGNPSRLDAALASVFEVIRNSEVITVLIVSDGQAKVHGTPFDEEINAACRQSVQEMKDHPMPLVMVLQAKAGKLVNYTVNALPWPVVIPEVPIRAQTASISGNRPLPSAPSGRTAVTNPPTAALSPSQSAVVPSAATIDSSQAPGIKPQSSPTLSVGPAPAPQPRSDPGSAQASKPVPVAVQTSKPFETPAPMSNSPTVGAPHAVPASSTESTTPAPPTPANLPPKSNEIPGLAENPRIETPATSAPSAKPGSPVTPTAPIIPPEDKIHPNGLLIAGVISLVIAAGLMVLFFVRSRASSGPSLITQTLGNPRN